MGMRPFTPTDLRRWRLRQGMTQAQAYVWFTGKKSPYGQQILGRWETGARPIPAPLAERIRTLPKGVVCSTVSR